MKDRAQELCINRIMNEQEVESNRIESNQIDIKVCVENTAQVEEAATSAVEENNNVNHKSNNCS